jgi:hypothetical protein
LVVAATAGGKSEWSASRKVAPACDSGTRSWGPPRPPDRRLHGGEVERERLRIVARSAIDLDAADAPAEDAEAVDHGVWESVPTRVSG